MFPVVLLSKTTRREERLTEERLRDRKGGKPVWQGGGVEPITATVKRHGVLYLLVFHGKGIVTAERGQMSRSAQFLG
jgi:hypothetical protein